VRWLLSKTTPKCACLDEQENACDAAVPSSDCALLVSATNQNAGANQNAVTEIASTEKNEPVDLITLSYDELQNWMVNELHEPRFRADQVWQWIWQRQVTDFDAMTDLSKKTREKLKVLAVMLLPRVVAAERSKDGTEKLLLELADGAHVETVLIPSQGRGENIRITQCLSTQVGCPMGCTFCQTATMGFIRNMTAGEMLSQVLIARQRLQDNRNDRPIIRNLVFMGMGEPLLNMYELKRTLLALHHSKGLDFSARRITVSTCGIEKGLKELGESGLAYLAVSLHAPNQALRAQIMPRAAKWNLDDLMDTLTAYPLKTREYVTFEYLLLGGVNDSPEHAQALVRLMSHLKSKLNLIVYNHSENLPYVPPTESAVLAFQQVLWDKGLVAILRKSKGQDIQAACGQLCAQHSAETRPV